jgi:hypothetical protein
MEVRVGNDNAGLFGPPDQAYLAERAKLERNRPRPTAPPAAPDPKILARGYLTRAGYAATDLDAALPLVQAAGDHRGFAKQFNGATPPARPWTAR